MLDASYSYACVDAAWSVCLSVSVLVTRASPAKTAKPTAISFGLPTCGAQSIHALDGVTTYIRVPPGKYD